MINDFGYIDYNPLFGGHETGNTGNELIPIDPEMVQHLYRRIFDLYCGMFLDRKGEFLSLLKIYNHDYRRTVMSIEVALISKEIDKMQEIFK